MEPLSLEAVLIAARSCWKSAACFDCSSRIRLPFAVTSAQSSSLVFTSEQVVVTSHSTSVAVPTTSAGPNSSRRLMGHSRGRSSCCVTGVVALVASVVFWHLALLTGVLWSLVIVRIGPVMARYFWGWSTAATWMRNLLPRHSDESTVMRSSKLASPLSTMASPPSNGGSMDWDRSVTVLPLSKMSVAVSFMPSSCVTRLPSSTTATRRLNLRSVLMTTSVPSAMLSVRCMSWEMISRRVDWPVSRLTGN
mmetsp:Transcript_30133/g.60474  ORF Transcript_30133/g.60474 Transcript_30133/m.60474 type:complete len:250 (+) Transcript_30133:735-1484(+)